MKNFRNLLLLITIFIFLWWTVKWDEFVQESWAGETFTKISDGYLDEGSNNGSDDIIIPFTEEWSKSEEAQKVKEQKESQENCNGWCCWIKLNTNFPIIWNCIDTKGSKTNPTNAFPYMVGALTKIVMSLVLVICFILIIISGIKYASDDPKGGRDLIKKVAITILLLWFSWVILRLINPNFFG